MDYAFLQDEIIEDTSEMGQEEAVRKSMTILVMVETLCGSVWSYATRGKGYASDQWLPKKIHNDLTTAGMGAAHISLKTDNEPAILEIRREVAKCRGDVPTGLDDSRVGDSNSNGKVERTVREVKGLIRTLRADLQDKIKEPIDLDSPVVPWLVRHAGYILTRCRVLECGRTALHRMKGQKSHRPIIPFGEVVMFKIPKTKRRLGDFEDRFEKGVWLGMTVQSGENIVATSDAVYRVGGVMRRAPDERWSGDMIKNIKGSPDEPKPGSNSDAVPTYVKHAEDKNDEKYEKEDRAPVIAVRPVRITRADIAEHGPTEDCRACRIAALNKPGHSTGGYAHTPACRARFEELFREAGLEKLIKADERLNQAAYDQLVGVEPSETAPEEENMDEDTATVPEAAATQGEQEEQGVPEISMATPPTTPTRAPPDAGGSVMAEVNRINRPPRGAAGAVRDAARRLAASNPAAFRAEVTRIQKKRQAEADVEDGSHSPGRPGVSGNATGSASSSTPATTSAATGSASTATASTAAPNPAPAAPSTARSKRSAQEEAGDDGERPHAYRCTDSVTPLMEIARGIMSMSDIPNPKDSTVGSREIMKHVGPIVKNSEITEKEKQWNDIGSGVFAKTFPKAERLVTTTRAGPPIQDVHRRTIWSLSKGRVIDDCIIDDTPDHMLNRYLEEPDDIRVELIMKQAVSMYMRKNADVVEVYSQPRIAQEAAEYNKNGITLRPGWSLDLTRADPTTGEPWDLSNQKVQSRVVKMINETKPLFLIGSPPCTAYSPLQALSKSKRDPKIVRAELTAARVHLEFCTRLYEMQIVGGRFFVHEHPHGALSWQEDCVKKVLMMEGVDTAVVDMCAYGMRVDTGKVQGPAKKRTRIMSNSKEVLKRIAIRCPNKQEDTTKHHVHVKLESGRASTLR